MANRLGSLTLEEAAQEASGIWRRWDSFAWFRDSELERPEDWFIYYGHHRDSGLLDQSNSIQIGKALQPFIEADTDDPMVVEEDHSHFLVGWIKGWSVLVYRDGEITEAFKVLHGLLERMAIYPVLSDESLSEMEYEATVSNIADAAWRLKDEYELPDEWQYEVYGWLSDNDPGEIENRDDQGGYPSEASLRAALTALDFPVIEGAI